MPDNLCLGHVQWEPGIRVHSFGFGGTIKCLGKGGANIAGMSDLDWRFNSLVPETLLFHFPFFSNSPPFLSCLIHPFKSFPEQPVTHT